MEKIISKIVKYILKKKYPVFTDVEVTSERDYERYFVDKKNNVKYNIFLTIDYSDFEPIRDSGNWDTLKSEIRNIVRASGIDNYINVYLNFSDEK